MGRPRVRGLGRLKRWVRGGLRAVFGVFGGGDGAKVGGAAASGAELRTATAPAAIFRFKQTAWVTADAAHRYAEGVALAGPGMVREQVMSRWLARIYGHHPAGLRIPESESVSDASADGISASHSQDSQCDAQTVARVLDAGAGTGRFARDLAARGVCVTALDVSQAMLRQGLSRATTPYPCLRGSAFRLPFADNTFDVTQAFWLLIHFHDWPAILAEMARVTRPGGAVLCEMGNRSNFEEADAAHPLRGLRDEYLSAGLFQIFLDEAEFRSVAVSLGLTVQLALPYDLFTDNCWEIGRLGRSQAPSWSHLLGPAAGKQRGFWNAWERERFTNAPHSVARKTMYVLTRNGAPPNPQLAAVSAAAASAAAGVGAGESEPSRHRCWDGVDCDPSDRDLAHWQAAHWTPDERQTLRETWDRLQASFADVPDFLRYLATDLAPIVAERPTAVGGGAFSAFSASEVKTHA